jgi:hypothetical protein
MGRISDSQNSMLNALSRKHPELVRLVVLACKESECTEVLDEA